MKSEMEKLIALLKSEDIPFEVVPHIIDGSPQLFYPNRWFSVCDAVCSDFSYGGSEGLLEVMGLVGNDDEDVEGWLIADFVFERIKKHYYEGALKRPSTKRKDLNYGKF